MTEDIPKPIRQYFDLLTKKCLECYKIAEKARGRGFDPEDRVEIPPAEDLASRVEELVGPPGVKDRINELKNKKLDIESIAFQITKEIVKGKFIKETDRSELAKLAIRAGLCILTAGITSAPIEGLVDVIIQKNRDDSEYIAMYFSGPIRSAGGTAAAQAVILGDYVRNLMDLDKYKPNDEEIERYLEEIILYKRIRNLQFPVKAASIRIAAKNIPIEITGEPTEKEEVTGYRNILRINTNKIRGGACLVLNDGIIGKSHKLLKIVDEHKIKGWSWIKALQEKNIVDNTDEEKVKPKDKFISGIIAGRPIFSHPSKRGGFRIRYGRVRNTGLAAVGLNIYTMKITGNFLVQGTQFVTERPGKGSISMAVDSIEGPTVKLYDGSVVKIDTFEKYQKYEDKIKKILYLGDVLIGFGEFLENNHILIPSGYTEDWWRAEFENLVEKNYNDDLYKLSEITEINVDRLKSFLENPFKFYPSELEVIKLSNALDLPIHPEYTYFWDYITKDDVLKIRDWFLVGEFITKSKDDDNKDTGEYIIKLPLKDHKSEKNILETLGLEHQIDNDSIIIDNGALILKELFVLDNPDTDFEFNLPLKENNFVGNFSNYKLRAKSPYRMGGRMGRPEKANERMMFHTLFPVGIEGGNRRDLIKAAEEKTIELEIINRRCSNCDEETISVLCPKCNSRTEIVKKCINPDCNKESNFDFCPYCHNPVRTYSKKKINISKMLRTAQKNIQEHPPKYIKGVKSLMNQNRIFEPLEKAIMRAKWDVYNFRDGTIRFDAVDAPLTHFKPEEIGLTLDKLKKLGYKTDYIGNPIESPNQIIELRPQDIIIPYSGAEFLVKVANFIDDLLKKFYDLNPYYRIDTIEDIAGQIIVGLAPHTSAGIVGRIIGFTNSRVCYAHPYWHACKRRNCDSDEDSIILLLDALLNFSRNYLPSTRGGLMDAPLVISIILHPDEVDKEVYNVEILDKYPLEFYEETLKYTHPKKLQDKIEIINHRLGKSNRYNDMHFTIPNSTIDITPAVTAYKKFEGIKEKVEAQLTLGNKIMAVDTSDEASRLLNTHFIPDIIGNMRAFGTQQVRCPKCNIKYRRMPLLGKCKQCGGNLIFTVHEGGIVKYLELAKEVANKYNLSNYMKQRLELTENDINSLFKYRKSIKKLSKFVDVKKKS
jgi:DNA polymerase II large subunit